MKIRTPAKVNLRLRVVGKRRDGYHLLDTIIVPVSLFDEIEISRERTLKNKASALRLKVSCRHPLVPTGEENLVYRAARLLLEKKKLRDGVAIRIRKNIPVGGGLGGGSSDAAATLRGLNRVFRLGCSVKELAVIAKSLGADAPFFLYNRPMRARGIGDNLRPLGPLPRLWLVILYPGFPVSTRWVYRNFSATLTKPIVNTSISALSGSPAELQNFLVNDLESVAIARYPRIGFLKKKLIQTGAAGALMSGSGSSVFGIFTSRRKAKQALSRLRKEKGVQAFLVRALD